MSKQEQPKKGFSTKYEWIKTMDTMIENIKGLLPLFAIVAALGGFYYTTQHRLDHLEGQMDEISSEVEQFSESLEQISRQVNKLERKANK